MSQLEARQCFEQMMNCGLTGRIHQLVLRCPSMRKFHKGSDMQSVTGNQYSKCSLTRISESLWIFFHNVQVLQQLTLSRTRWYQSTVNGINRQRTLCEGNCDRILITHDVIRRGPAQEKWLISIAHHLNSHDLSICDFQLFHRVMK
jgi:hypothetical protein